jgi:integrase
MAKSPQRVGIESRIGADGKERHRAAGIRVPGSTKRVHGPWRAHLAEARGDRTRLLARRDAAAGQFAQGSVLPTFRAAVDDWLDRCTRGDAWARGRKPYAPKTLRGYRSDLDRYACPAFGDTPLDRVRRSAIQQLVDEVAALHSGQKARNVATAIMALYRFWLGRFDDLTDPTVGLDLPAGSAPRERIVTPDELLALLDALDDGDRAPFALAGMAGLRHGEIKALRVRDVGDRLEVRGGWDAREGRREPKSRRSARDVPIIAPLAPILEAQLATLGPDVCGDYPVVPGVGQRGSRIGLGVPMDLSGMIARARKRWRAAGLDGIVLHEARHSFASHLIVAGFDVATVAEWIGHSQASTTLDRYVKPLRSRGVEPSAVQAYLGLGTQAGTQSR